MALHLLLIYCGVYLVCKPVLLAWRHHHLNWQGLANQGLLLLTFANLCFWGVWHTDWQGPAYALAFVGFNASLALPVGCAVAQVEA